MSKPSKIPIMQRFYSLKKGQNKEHAIVQTKMSYYKYRLQS